MNLTIVAATGGIGGLHEEALDAGHLVCTRSGSMAPTVHPLAGLNAAFSSCWLTGCGPVLSPSSLKHNTYRVPSCLVTDGDYYRGFLIARTTSPPSCQ